MNKINKWVDRLSMQANGWVLYGWCTVYCTRLSVLAPQFMIMWHRTYDVH